MYGCDFGFLDSGTGGLTYMLYLKKACPESRCIYLGDTRNFPYGEKSREQIIDCATEAVEKLIALCNPRVIVIACNTMSVTALDALRRRFAVPFVGTVPAVKLAASLSANRRIGLLSTSQTASHPYTAKLIADFAAGCTVIKRGDPALIEFIEKRLFTANEAERLAAVRPAVNFFKEHGVDTIILGCTHFIHLAAEIAQEAGSAVRVVDSRDGVVRQALKLVRAAPHLQPEPHSEELISCRAADGSSCGSAALESPIPDMSFFTTGIKPGSVCDDGEYQALAEHLHIHYQCCLPE